MEALLRPSLYHYKKKDRHECLSYKQKGTKEPHLCSSLFVMTQPAGHLSAGLRIPGLVSANVSPVSPEIANVTAHVLSVLPQLMPVAPKFAVINFDFATIRAQFPLCSPFAPILPLLAHIRSHVA